MKNFSKWIFLAGVVLSLSWAWWFTGRKPSDSWDLFESEYRRFSTLEMTVIDEIDYDDKPLHEAVREIVEQVNEMSGANPKWTYEFLDSEVENFSARIRLEEPAAGLALRYVCSTASDPLQNGFDSPYMGTPHVEFLDGNKILIHSEKGYVGRRTIEADFKLSYPPTFSMTQPMDLTAYTRQYVDIESATYYPKEFRLKVRGPIDELEMLNYYFNDSHLDQIPDESIQDRWKLKIRDWIGTHTIWHP